MDPKLKYGTGNLIGKSLLATDIVLIVVFVVLGAWFTYRATNMPYIWHLSPELSIPSVLLLLKWLFASLFCFIGFLYKGGSAALASAIIFLILFADDTLQMHDRRINVLSYQISLIFPLGFAVLAALLVGFTLQSTTTRVWFFQFSLLLVGLFLCGMVVDQIAEQFRSSQGIIQKILGRMASITEDGGEMIFGSLLAGHAFDLLKHSKDMAAQ